MGKKRNSRENRQKKKEIWGNPDDFHLCRGEINKDLPLNGLERLAGFNRSYLLFKCQIACNLEFISIDGFCAVGGWAGISLR